MEALSPAEYSGGTRALVDLLLNRDQARFEELYARLPQQVRAAVRELSPLLEAQRLAAPVELATSPHDSYFPPAESRALARASSGVRVTVTSTFDHVVPRPSIRGVGDLFRFDGFVVRFLREARG
jgi:hypothetical protein